MELVFRTDNLYLEGFIAPTPGTHIQNYYYFNFQNINMQRQPQTVRDGTVPHLTTMVGMEYRELTHISPDYIDLLNPDG